MKYKLLHQDLLNLLRNRIPQNSKLVAKLIDVLSLEKMAVYRRLRQEVPFTFEEIIVIAREFNISLDNLLGVDARPSFPFPFHAIDEENQNTESDYLLLKNYVQAIKAVASNQDGEIALITNVLPQSLYTGFDSIFRFYYFKWRYYSLSTDQTKPYHEIILPDRFIQVAKDAFDCLKNVGKGYFIFDYLVFQRFINDVTYFNTIRLIKDEDVRLIKKELLQFIDYMEIIAKRGFIANPSNKIDIYISETSIDTSYCYIEASASFRFALIWSFVFNIVLTYKDEMLEMMKCWIRSKIRTSTLLSVTSEKTRTQYFDMQRKVVEQM